MHFPPKPRRSRPLIGKLFFEPLEGRCLLSYSFTDLGTLGGTFSKALAINASGQVAGISSLVGGHRFDAFLYSDGTMTDLGTLGGLESWGYGINASGQVVGMSRLFDDNTIHAYLYSDGVMTDLGTPPGRNYSFATGINASGDVSGKADFADGEHASIYSQGKWADLGTLGGGFSFSVATGINDPGQVAGLSDISDGMSGPHAFLYSDGAMWDLGTLGGARSYAYAINNAGQVVGTAAPPSNGFDAFLYSDGVMTDLGSLPGDNGSDAYAINNQGQVVGRSVGPHGQIAFVYSDGQMTALNDLIPPGSGWSLESAQGINDAGQIVGYGTNPSREQHAYLLTPDEGPARRGLAELAALADRRSVSAIMSSPIPDAAGVFGSARLFWDAHFSDVLPQQMAQSQRVHFSAASHHGLSLLPRPDRMGEHAVDILFALQDIGDQFTGQPEEGT